MKAAKFHRQRDQRRALIKQLAESLILNGSIETTLPKAKAVARYTEKLIGKAKKGQTNLHSRRQVIAGLATVEAGHKLVDEIAPQLDKRNSGYFRVKRSQQRLGDRAQMAKVSFVDELKAAKPTVKAPVKKTKIPAKAIKKKPATKPEKAETAIPLQPEEKRGLKERIVPFKQKRSGRRGDR